MTIEWKISKKPVDYLTATTLMEKRVEDIIAGKAKEMVWLLEHPPLYTAGTSAKETDLLDKDKFPVYKTGRGGEFTYHGPGQRVAYIMLDLKKRGMADVKKFVWTLEEIIIETLSEYGIKAERRKGRVGIWVENEEKEKKIAAIGIRVRKWVTWHGLAVNLHPDLSHFSGIVPCGIKEYGVTSFKELGIHPKNFDGIFKKYFQQLFLIK